MKLAMIREKLKVPKLTVLVGFLEVHVDDTTGPDVVHLRTKKSGNFGKVTGRWSVATVLGEEDGDRVRAELFSADIIAGLSERRVTAPGVDVVTPEVNSLALVGTAVEVVGHVHTNVRVIVGSVSNANSPQVLLLHVRLHVADSGLDESTGIGVVRSVGDLVSGEETHDVGVLSHVVNDSSVAGVQVVVPCWGVTVDGLCWLGQISNDVDAGVVQELHARVVVLSWVDGVNTNDVGAELSEERDITTASGGVGKRVLVTLSGGIAGLRGRAVGRKLLLVSNTPHVAVDLLASRS